MISTNILCCLPWPYEQGEKYDDVGNKTNNRMRFIKVQMRNLSEYN